MRVTPTSLYPKATLQPQNKNISFGKVEDETKTFLKSRGVSQDTIQKLDADEVLTVKGNKEAGKSWADPDKNHKNYWAYKWLYNKNSILNLLLGLEDPERADDLADSLPGIQRDIRLGKGHKSEGLGYDYTPIRGNEDKPW